MRLARAGVPLREGGEAWSIELTSEADIDFTLVAIAQWLHANGLGSAWRNERLSVTDVLGGSVGCIERAAVRPLGIATHAVHLVASDESARVWVQQRAFDKATDPGRWDTTMGGLVSAGESTLQTLARETWEEAGLRIEALRGVVTFGRFTVRRPVAEGYMVEHIDMFEATVPDGLVPSNQDGEVERFECLDRVSLVERLHADAFTLEAGMILATWLEWRAATGR
jgi:8-oxo-dGTP pyrophosphatase MutT (NUDIX family)